VDADAKMVTGIPASNALWLGFLSEWIDEAQSKGSKVARTYRKAHQSLSACPIDFQHPCQTTQLAGIGPTIAAKLEQELQKWCQANGVDMPEKRKCAQLP
jgi:crossover junction endonuclease MUS81